MSYVNIKNEFHVALDGQGLLLQGAPERLISAYEQSQAPVYGNRFASGDRDYNDLSLWWYLTQTDWAGGIKDNVSFLDDIKYYYSSNLDVRTQPSAIKLERTITSEISNATNSEPILDFKEVLYSGAMTKLYLDATIVRKHSDATSLTLNAATPSGNAVWFDSYREGLYRAYSSGDIIYSANSGSSIDIKANIQTDSGYTSISEWYGGFQDAGILYLFGRRSGANNVLAVKSSAANPAAGSVWTGVFNTFFGSSTPKIIGVDGRAGIGVFLIQEETAPNTFGLWQVTLATGSLVKLETFTGVNVTTYQIGHRYVRAYKTGFLITLPKGSDGEGEIYFYNLSTLTRIYSTEEKKVTIGLSARGYLRGGAVIYDNLAFWGNLVYDGTTFFNFIKDTTDSLTLALVPVGKTGEKLILADTAVVSGDQQLVAYSYDFDGTTYKDGANNEAFLVLSQHDKLQSIDKLMNSVIIGFEKLLTGQAINIYYTTNAIPTTSISDWTLLGTASYAIDGDTHYNKTFTFPSATVAKKIWFRVELVSATAGTPVLTDLTLEYLPMPPYKKEWKLNVNCGDNVKRLNGGLVQTTGRELKSRLEIAWWTKSLLDYQDMDYATNLLNGSITASSATLTVDSTLEFPEQGRVKIDDEEIFYSGKTPTTFTGLTRGARGTRAVAHSDNAVINNAYKVIITGISSRVPIALDANYLEYTVQLSIREG